MSHTESDNHENQQSDAEKDRDELVREKDVLEQRLNDAEDLLRWLAEIDPEEGWEQAKKYPVVSDQYAFAWGWANGELKVIAQRARAFLKAGEHVYNRPAKLPPQDSFGLPCPTCDKPEASCECAEMDEESVAKVGAEVLDGRE